MPIKQSHAKNRGFSKYLKTTPAFFRKNYIIVIFSLVILFVGIIVVYKYFHSGQTYVYAKVKMGQGYWWVTAARPPIWFANAINKGDVSYGVLGNPTAEVINKSVYRYFGSDQYDVYLTLILKVGFNKKTQQYTFDRSVLSVGSPVDIQFPKEDVTGTVIALSNKPFNDDLAEKTITLVKKYAYPFEFDSIVIGDSYNDGERKVFEVLDKSSQIGGQLLAYSNTYANSGSPVVEPANYVTVKAKIKMKKVNGQWLFGEDQIVSPGRSLGITTPNFVFDNYIVSKIE